MSMTTSGKNVNLTLEEGKETRFRLRMWSKDAEWSGEGLTFAGEVRDVVTGIAVGDILVEWSGVNRLLLVFPALGLGRYVFVVDASGDTGQSVRLLDGYVSYGQQESVKIGDECEEADRTLNVMVSGEVRRVMFGRSSVAEDAADRAENAYGEAVATIERAEEERRELIEAAEVLHESVSGALTVSKEGTLVIGGVDSGFVLRGEDGVAPKIGDDGYWYEWQGNEWVKTEHKAIGVDGVDGSKFRYILLDSEAALETVTQKYGVLYIVPTDSGHAAFAWVEHADGSGEWVRMDNVQQVATFSQYGFGKLGTDATIVSGFPVGNNANGRLSVNVPYATRSSAGLVRYDLRMLNCEPMGALSFVGVAGATADSADGLVKKDVLGFNVLGALQYRNSTVDLKGVSAWKSGEITGKMPWVDGAVLNPNNQCLGLLTTDVFEQSAEKGLDLLVDDASFTKKGKLSIKPATTSTLGGVVLAGSLEEAEKVPTAALVKEALGKKSDAATIDAIVEQKVKNAVDAAIAAITGAPAGQVEFFAGPCEIKDSLGNWKALEPPNGYLWCHGQEVSRVTYAKLFNVIGTVYGDGDGSTTFNVPSAEDYFLRVYRRHDGVTDTRKLGTTQDSGSPNITGDIIGAPTDYAKWECLGVFSKTWDSAGYLRGGGGGTPAGTNINFNASRCSSVYKDGLTEVRPKNINFNLIIKY